MLNQIINYDIFIEKRPDMEVHTSNAIWSCINSAYVLLDGECASLISKVENFNYNENGLIPDRDTKDILYRTDFELGQLQEALVFQVQYVLNMGNDFTIGGGSYSIGNVNSSYNRPEGRELIAPGVYKLLSNARVYNLNAFGSFNNQDKEQIPLSTSKEIMERVKNEYVAINQPQAQVGQIAYVNQSNKVDFGNPQDLQIDTYNTKRVAGGEGFRTNYYEIDKVPNIAFFGPDLDGTYSAVHREEMIKALNDKYGDYFSKEEVLAIVYASGVAWRSDLQYQKDWIVQVVNDKNELEYYIALQDSIGKNPKDSANKDYWKKLTTQEVDLNLIIEQLQPWIDKEINKQVKEEVQEQLDNLPTTNYRQETKDQVLAFKDLQDYETFRDLVGKRDDDFEDVIIDTYYSKEEVDNLLKNKANLTSKETQHFNNKNVFNETTSIKQLVLGEENYYIDYQYSDGKILALTGEAQTINEDYQLTTKEYVDNIIPKKIFSQSQQSYYPTINATSTLTNIDMTKKGIYTILVNFVNQNIIRTFKVYNCKNFKTFGFWHEWTETRIRGNNDTRWAFKVEENGDLKCYQNISNVDTNKEMKIWTIFEEVNY